MYTIIGGDQKEYGPISEDELRQWIIEGRLNEQSMVKAEGESEFRPLGSYPEFIRAFVASQPIPKAKLSAAVFDTGTGSAPEKTDYELDMGGCISSGWGLVKNNFGTLFVCLLVLLIVAGAFLFMLGLVVSLIVPKHLMGIAAFKVVFNLVLSCVSAVVMGPLLGGLYLVYLRMIRGEPTGVADVFAGFQKSFVPLFLGYLVVVLATGLCMAPFSYFSAARLDPLLAHMQGASPADIQNLTPQIMSTLVGILPILLICMIPLTYLSVNWMFTQALIIDKQLDFGTAMKTSWKMVHKHWWHVFGLLVVTGLLNVAGAFLCCIGLLLTVPVGFAALMFAYETIFSEESSA